MQSFSNISETSSKDFQLSINSDDCNLNRLPELLSSLKNLPNNLVINISSVNSIKLNDAQNFLQCIQANPFPPGTKIHFSKAFIPDDHGQNQLAIALKSNTNIVYLDFSKVHGSATSQETILHCLKRNRLLAKYPELREKILLLSFLQDLYIPPAKSEFKTKYLTSQCGLFAEKSGKHLLALLPDLNAQQRTGLEKMLHFGS